MISLHMYYDGPVPRHHTFIDPRRDFDRERLHAQLIRQRADRKSLLKARHSPYSDQTIKKQKSSHSGE